MADNSSYNWASDLLALPNFITNTVLGAKNYQLQKNGTNNNRKIGKHNSNIQKR